MKKDDSSIGTANIFKDRIVNARHVHIRGKKYHQIWITNMINIFSQNKKACTSDKATSNLKSDFFHFTSDYATFFPVLLFLFH